MRKISSGRLINLGCGGFPLKGFINVDINKDTAADIISDLNHFPYPFKDEASNLIIIEHALEHLNEPLVAIKEIYRILMPGGKLIVKVPHFSRGFTHPGHRSGFDLSFSYNFSPHYQGGYVGVEFKLEKFRFRWFAQENLKKTVLPPVAYVIAKFAGILVDMLANASPFFCSRVWAFWVGGFDEIEFHFIKPEC
jgi:SAM-dependent methyltransferase